MRIRAANQGLRALAVAGNHVVLIGWDLAETEIRQSGILGFAIERRRASDGEVIWLKDMKMFPGIGPDPGPGNPVSTFDHPIQSFQWADYSVSPDQAYTYRLVAMTGRPGALTPWAEVSLAVRTEPVDHGRHAVFFNRGAVASQAYARQFLNQPPDRAGQAAFDWLSRGLVEGLQAFVTQAGPGDALHGAFFEFKSPLIHAALTAAIARGAAVRVLYDGDSQREGNEAALAGAGLDAVVKARTRSGSFAHNKFFVLSRAGAPAEVWTGSTNLTQNGIFGHSNNAHIIRDPAIATRFLDYWHVLDADRTLSRTRAAVAPLSPVPGQFAGDTAAVFSPKADLAALDWYAEMAGNAGRALMGTFAFGMDARFVRVYDRADGVLRFALMEKKGNGKQYKVQAAEIDRIRRRPNTVIAVGNTIPVNSFDRWLAEIDRIDPGAHVRFIHTKYMLIDPLGDTPVVIVGSANFSKASTDTNDENMLVIRGDTAVADIYLGEFMRLYSHYAFRESLTFKDATPAAAAQERGHLVTDTSWIDGGGPRKGYFVAGGQRALRRLYFSGQ